MFRQDMVHLFADTQNFPCMDVDLRCLPLHPAERLMQHECVREATRSVFPLPLPLTTTLPCSPPVLNKE